MCWLSRCRKRNPKIFTRPLRGSASSKTIGWVCPIQASNCQLRHSRQFLSLPFQIQYVTMDSIQKLSAYELDSSWSRETESCAYRKCAGCAFHLLLLLPEVTHRSPEVA